MIRYRCPSCGAQLESNDEAVGIKHTCKVCGRWLEVPTARKTLPRGVRYAGDSQLLPRWLWLPMRVEPPENSGETVIRFVTNVLRIVLLLFVLKMLLLAVICLCYVFSS